ncbi:opine dehydrogenase-like [Mytilus edulis]|uniref:opine dehydrogenase-like n=1 Tax=Mytilus edulis TaxID=6550 RepID=UPI0039EEE62F
MAGQTHKEFLAGLVTGAVGVSVIVGLKRLFDNISDSFPKEGRNLKKGVRRLKILVCGGGNGAHCMAGVAGSHAEIDVKILSLFEDEAERWSNILKSNFLTVYEPLVNGGHMEISTKPKLVTNDPEKAVEGVDIVFMVVPAFAHSQYITAIAPFIKPNTLIVGMPGQAGFEFQCINILGQKSSQLAIASFESLPWACRVDDFGKHVQLIGFKDVLGMSVVTGKDCKIPFPIVDTIQDIFGKKPAINLVQNYIAINLMAKSIIHPPLMYGHWSNWDGKPVREKPLFYQGVDPKQANLLSKVSDECILTAKKIEKLRNDLKMKDVIHIFDWYKTYYHDEITDDSSLMMAMKTNAAYDGLLHPMKNVEGGFVPDFNYRYTREDIPYGLVVMKGIAELAGVATPTMDEIITWAQNKLGKEYLVNGRLTGKDLKEARAPQSFGFKTLDELFNI